MEVWLFKAAFDLILIVAGKSNVFCHDENGTEGTNTAPGDLSESLISQPGSLSGGADYDALQYSSAPRLQQDVP